MTPTISVVILTLNEEDAITDSLASLAKQRFGDFETIIIDAASDDQTVSRARQAGRSLPGDLRIHVDRVRIPIGAARNIGVRMARAPFVVYLSADARLHPDWLERAANALRKADMAFGQQFHTPHRWTTTAAVRGLRYHYPDGDVPDATLFASNVAGAYRRDLLLRHPFDEDADGAEDLVLARRAAKEGAIAVYDPRMRVEHGDVDAPRQELRKNVREGRGWARYRRDLGLARPWLLWGAALAGAALLSRRPRHLAACAALLWAPTLRRAMRRRNQVPAPYLVRGVIASPMYDLAFLACYVRGLVKEADA